MAVSKTRLKLVEVARILFAKNGLENTTMNDIAVASKKGRRTLYTYFKNKEELYYAVIETELERLTQKMSEVALRNIPPEEKLLELVFAHLNLIKEAVFRNGNLRAEFFRDIWMVEKVRKNFDLAEINLIQKVLTEGIQQQIFEIQNLPLISDIIHYCIKGLEVPYIYGRLGEGLNQETCKPMVQTLLNRALKKI
ncbi:TetR/AcrR family transcriptional regulator [Bacteroides sp. OF04-15BH]|jgi:AcrR family transcriptional regulator|uniref:TetR/AcrR family transcriptional regulator n=1 Tax=Bacteroides sp. OF04-15BH TaxID=2292281 RepID=UPI000E4C5A95|nr:TetR/AcrR family transcriptional regulator [Bacteroides sp. OF04-15BH]RHP67272.1 TetR/AcrR family transcriptional regulator [Bacteroides sp. OF04-15BH]